MGASTVFKIEQILGLVQLGWTTFQAIRGAITAGKASIETTPGVIVTSAEAIRALDDAIAAILLAGDAAADRLIARNPTQ